MQTKINLAGLVVVLALLSFSGCASTSGGSSTSSAQAPAGEPPGAIKVQQAGTTSYMQSQVGTPNELSPLAPAEAKNVRKVGNQWLCDINGQTMVFDSASSCWEPHQK